VSQFLNISNYKPYPASLPIEVDPETLYKVRKRNPLYPTKWMNFRYCPFSEFWWGILGVEEWLKVGEEEFTQVENPIYTEQANKRAELKSILQTYLIQMGSCMFPVLPLGYRWFEKEGFTVSEADEIPQDPNHILAVTNLTVGYKLVLKPVPVNFNSSHWDSLVGKIISIPGDAKVKSILNI